MPAPTNTSAMPRIARPQRGGPLMNSTGVDFVCSEAVATAFALLRPPYALAVDLHRVGAVGHHPIAA